MLEPSSQMSCKFPFIGGFPEALTKMKREKMGRLKIAHSRVARNAIAMTVDIAPACLVRGEATS